MSSPKFTTAEVAQAADGDARIAAGLAAVWPIAALSGPAATCRCAPADNLALHRALLQASAGSVLVCDAGGRADGGYFGELMALDARGRGVDGLVIDGSVRDLAEFERLRFPVFHRGTCPRSCRKHRASSVGEAVVVGGVEIHPGDHIVADADGVVVVAQGRWKDVCEGALDIRDREREIRAALRAGARLADIIGIRPQATDEADRH